jgi:hypothetical protein
MSIEVSSCNVLTLTLLSVATLCACSDGSNPPGQVDVSPTPTETASGSSVAPSGCVNPSNCVNPMPTGGVAPNGVAPTGVTPTSVAPNSSGQQTSVQPSTSNTSTPPNTSTSPTQTNESEPSDSVAPTPSETSGTGDSMTDREDTSVDSDTTDTQTSDPSSETESDASDTSGEEPVDDDVYGPDLDGACTASTAVNRMVSGSGPHDVVVESNSDSGINEGTIFRPADLGEGKNYPIYVWGEGGCSQNGLSNATAMAEIASHGYFVVADGKASGGGENRPLNGDNVEGMAEPLLNYVEWATKETAKPCSAYYHSINPKRVAANGFSCGGLMSEGTAPDPRMTTWGQTSSGMFSVDTAFYQSVHTPVLIIQGSADSTGAYDNGMRDYENISPVGVPIMFFGKQGAGHGGDLGQAGGEFNAIILAWLNWWLKDDEGATGKGALVGDACSYCSDDSWVILSDNLP